ncbi:MAG: sensor histidine kinase, partial [Calditrichaeota bacterium]
MKISLRQKIILLVLSLLLMVTVAASFFSLREIIGFFESRIHDEMRMELAEISYLLEQKSFDFSRAEDYQFFCDYTRISRYRLTLIDSIGQVFFDSELLQDSLINLPNHLDRPEIQMAAKKGFGQYTRMSTTLNQTMFYAAQKRDGFPGNPSVSFIRLALPREEMLQIRNTLRWKITAGGGLALFLIAIISTIMANRLTLPIHRLVQVAEEIKQGNTQARFDDTRGDEISELAELLNQMLNKLQEDLVRLKQLERMRSQFLGNVSHELRTPIFSVQGYLETLMQSPISDPKKQQKFIQNAYRQAVRLNNLLTDLIDISRIESGEMKMTFERFSVYDWLRRIVIDMEETASKNDVNLELVNEPENHLYILGDRERLTQVIQNLVTNAIKYNVPNGRVEVGYTESKNRIDIFVADTGRGIAKEHLPRIFERFYRVDKERSRQVGGTGLGLAIVKHIIEAHGSKVFVHSEVGV